MKIKKLPTGLYGIISPRKSEDVLHLANNMIQKGARIIQYRDKVLDDYDFLRNARKIKTICEANDVFFIINDRAKIAKALDVHVHVGQEDTSPSELRKSGYDNIIGYTLDSYYDMIHLDDKIIKAVDYFGVGPIYNTPEKPDKKPVGLLDAKRIIKLSTLPVYLIGGIKKDNIDKLLSINPAGVVVMSHKFNNNEIIDSINKYYNNGRILAA